jgi:uncharacterized protein (UPF0332 family)
MKKISFLAKLRKEGKLQIVEPSSNMKESFTLKSENSLKSSVILLENDQIENSVPMAYYSMYNMPTALLYFAGIKCENHSGAIILLKELFEIDNSKISFAKTERVDKQYYVDFKVSRPDAELMIEKAREFNSILYDFIDKLTTKQISDYRKKFEEIC